jgi:drug/metabolite transporter (DMT)-like permease
MTAVAQKEISFLYPLTSVNYVIVAGTSVVFFHEVISTRRAFGVLVIVLGMLLMNRKSSKLDLQ